TDWYEAGRASPEALRQAIKKSWKLPKPEPEAEEQREENRPTPVQFAQKLGQTERFRWRFHNEQKTWREWNNQYWEAIPGEKVGDAIYHQAKHQIKTNAWVKDCQSLLERELRQWKWMPPSQTAKAFANGVVNMETFKLSPHDPENYNTSIINRDWWTPEKDPIKDPLQALKTYCPNIYEAWHYAMGGDERKILKLLAVCHAVMTWRFSTLQKFIHLIGRPGTGKGTFSRLLTALVGGENAKSSKLAKLGNDYDLAHWIDGQLVILPDEGAKVSDAALDNLKSLTGGDSISYRQIYEEVDSSPFYGTLLMISNDPLFRGETGALKRRLCLIEFDQPIPNRSHWAEELMMREVSQLTYCALVMPSHQVDESINELGEYEIPEFRSKQWELETAENSVADFLDTQLIPIAGCKTRTKDIYDEYKTFCMETGQKAVAMNKTATVLTWLE
ncbi:phage/plasmid primase, P4 family, partial [Roseofilum sp. Belize Diploria]|uniref:DNA primase family protein n=1 Tax=Roseofilum sp. Belize Diploria TaxID=2821501 RepID=UPI001B1709BF